VSWELSSAPTVLKCSAAQLFTRLLSAVVHMYDAPPPAFCTGVQAVQVSCAPAAPSVLKKPVAHALTRLSLPVVHVTLASAAMLATDVQAVHSPAANVPGT